ncbi:MGDG synthase family glycosyltransferase [Salirhabdus salicampi]|uniref:MGDG synthase family glycosyltransferase n=1 Tax=Salirhabdus salicampi TaxID=476102 RepID=UPI0020C33317|nr:glycosyltransferase [Salirhabdus salicampi]MCP8615617.1 UDP-glucuronosyltransferase [Salirhabdus salicampi]
MRKVLFMPFLQIPSGHHQVADALAHGLTQSDPNIQCEKIDILQYTFGKMESFISGIYLKWIHYLPEMYSKVYQLTVGGDENVTTKRFYHYELFFESAMETILAEKTPNVVVCTHALPSYILSRLKMKGTTNVTVINVYTDYFIHCLWGLEEIDYHFVPSNQLKQELVHRGVKENNIYVTGIPVHPLFYQNKKQIHEKDCKQVLVTGGSLGVGMLESFLQRLKEQDIHYYVLCGKNERLFNTVKKWGRTNITPIPYISDREKMNELYNMSDAIITKPGGVTISESLFKKVPIFVYHTLPGQEEFNFKHLNKLGLARDLQSWEREDSFEEELIHFFTQSSSVRHYFDQLEMYHSQINKTQPAEIIAHTMEK